jgi:lysophospholipase L1-like esterase
MEGVVAIPHLGASTAESEDNCAKMAVKQMMNYLENGNIANSVNFPACDMGICTKPARLAILHRNIPNTLSQFTSAVAKDNINISFIGGSNTVSHHPNGWVQKTADNIKEKTGVEKVTVNNAGYGGTGSNFGVYRLENDVIKTNPDIVFIEFAGNDRMDMWREVTEDLTTGLPAGKEFDTIYKVSDNSEVDATETGGESYYIYNNVSVGRYMTESDGRTFHYANHKLTDEELNGVGTTKVEKKTFIYNKAGADSTKRNVEQMVRDLIKMENPPAKSAIL